MRPALCVPEKKGPTTGGWVVVMLLPKRVAGDKGRIRRGGKNEA